MRVLIVSHHAPPMASTGTLRVASFASHFVREGHDVTLLTTAKRDDQRGEAATPSGVALQEVPFSPPALLRRLRRGNMSGSRAEAAPKSFAGRVRERSGAFGSARAPDLTDAWVRPAVAHATELAEQPWDLVVSSSGPYTAHLVARAIVRAGIADKWIADFRDLWTANPVFKGVPLVRAWERRTERSVLREADAITTVAAPLCDWFSAQGCRRVREVRNGFDPDAEIDPAPAFESSGAFNVVYTGTIYPNQPDPAGWLAGLRLSGRTVKLHIAGDRAYRWTGHSGPEVVVHGVLPRRRVLAMQRDADAILVLGTEGAGYGALPVKMLDALPMRAPILLIGGPAHAPAVKLLADSGRGSHLPPTAHAVAEAIAHPKDTPRVQQVIDAHTREAQAARLSDLVQRL
ncbi:MAG: glycosyltransferase [Planctomycetota bacterium]